METTLKTIEDLVAYASRPYGGDSKWQLEDWKHYRVWDDPAAGEAWYVAEREAKKAVEERGDNWYESPERDHICEQRPTEHDVTNWSLARSDGRWRSTTIHLSEDLGKQIDAVWTHKNKYGCNQRIGTLTLPGICKRLGRTDVGDRVKAAQKAEQEKSDRNARNYVRRQVVEAAIALEKALNKAREESGVTIPFDVDSLNPLKALEMEI